jgi:diguanylate cyclase (GGDEF)-like protein
MKRKAGSGGRLDLDEGVPVVAQDHSDVRVRDGAAGWDLVLTVVATLLGAAVLVRVAAFDSVLGRNESPSTLMSGTIVALAAILPLTAGIYAMRRHREVRRLRAEMARRALHDPLTGLPNRTYLTHSFADVLRKAQRGGGRVGVLFLDLDRLKLVNDTYGHEVGDKILIGITNRIQRLLPSGDVLIRYGGDEFVAICPSLITYESAERLAKRLISDLEQPFGVGQDRVRVSVSVGVALSEERCETPDEVIRDADAALYQAKAGGSGTFAVYDRSMRERLTPSTAERRLRQALQQGQFLLYYQPVVSMQTRQIVKVEALVRWEDPERGLVSPGEFIPALEDTGLIVPVGTWILEEACRQARAWELRLNNRARLAINVNVSARQLAQSDFPTVLGDALRRSQVSPDLITLEITEGALMYDVQGAWAVLRHARQLGVTLALDDFGTGFSSLTHLRKFKLDFLKIDKSFVDGLGISPEDTTIVEHIIGMARGLGMTTVAEGIETEEQDQLLRSLGCHLGQGYLYCPPRPPAAIEQLLRTPPPTPDDLRLDHVLPHGATSAAPAPVVSATVSPQVDVPGWYPQDAGRQPLH